VTRARSTRLDRIRRDITEGRPGVPLTLKIRVIDVKICAPDQRPRESGIATGGSTRTRARTAPANLLRGRAAHQQGGYATLTTIYPGH